MITREFGLLFAGVFALGLLCSCSAFDVILGSGSSDPKVSFSAEPLEGYAPHTVTLDASASIARKGNIARYDWDYNDDGTVDSTTTTPVTTHIYLTAGEYTCCLYVVDNEERCAEARITISVSAMPWPVYGGDRRHTKFSEQIGAPKKVTKWIAYTDGFDELSSPAVGPGDVIYVTSGYVSFIESSSYSDLYAFNPDGSLRWKAPLGGAESSMPAVASDGSVYVTQSDGSLYAISSEGIEQWVFATGEEIDADPAIGIDGTIYFGCNDDNLYAVNPDGSLKWSYLTDGDIRGCPAIGDDGTLYFIDYRGWLVALAPDGSLRWRFDAYGRYVTSPVVGADGSVYTSGDGVFYSIDPDGEVNWSYDRGSWISSQPTLHADGRIYAISTGNNLLCLNSDGSLLWSVNTGCTISNPAVDASGALFACADDNLLALNPDGSRRWSYRLRPPFSHGDGDAIGMPAIGSDGTVYFCAVSTHDDPALFAFDPNPPATNEPPDGDADIFTDSEGEAPFEVGMGLIDYEDPDGNIISIDWDFDGDNEFEVLDGSHDYLWTYTEPGVYVPKVRLTDNEGASTILDVGTVTIH